MPLGQKSVLRLLKTIIHFDPLRWSRLCIQLQARPTAQNKWCSPTPLATLVDHLCWNTLPVFTRLRCTVRIAFLHIGACECSLIASSPELFGEGYSNDVCQLGLLFPGRTAYMSNRSATGTAQSLLCPLLSQNRKSGE